jgi:hypothetical protein
MTIHYTRRLFMQTLKAALRDVLGHGLALEGLAYLHRNQHGT